MAKPLWLSFVFACVCVLSSSPAFAKRNWAPVDVPGAVCGDGSDYKVLVSEGDPRRVAVELMGGGACWNFATCFGPTPMAWIHPIPFVVERDGFVSDDPAESPAAGATLVYFPYCTGDVHLGDHVATYGPGHVYHFGRSNFELAIAYLQDTGLVDFHSAESAILYGYSAGALGALYHVTTLDPYLDRATTKVVLADSPGLHFGEKFWQRFPDDFLRDFSDALSRVGMSLDTSTGNIAALVPAVCGRYPAWRFGILQGSRDTVMSRLFGSISPEDHEKLVYGPGGLYELTLDPSDNCAAWVPQSTSHTFLPRSVSAHQRTSDGVSAVEFAIGVANGTSLENHR